MKNRMVDRRLFSLIAATIFQGTLILAIGSPARAQVVQATGPLPSFEAATIKPARGGSPLGMGIPLPNMFRLFNVTTRDLILIAYGLPPGAPGSASTRVLGGPAWIDNNHYDVEGKIPDAIFAEIQKSRNLRREQTLLMAQSLLAERFKLVAHLETREMPIYNLVVAKGGPKLTVASESQPGDAAPPPPTEPGKPPSPANMRQGIMILPKTKNVMEMTAKGQTMNDFAHMPFLGLSSPVVNMTGLTGKYDFTLDWARDQDGPPTDAQVDPEAPGLFTAIQEQLGLKLVPTKGPVDVIVIDQIELPSEN